MRLFAGGGESHRERHLRGGEQDPGAADPDQPVPTQAAPGQHQPAQHVPERGDRCSGERRNRPVPGGKAEESRDLPVGGFNILTFVLVQQAFFDKDYISSHAEDMERITHLKDLMQEQVGTGFGFFVRLLVRLLLTGLRPCSVAGSHPRGGAGRPREAGAPGDASPAQEARRPVSHDEDGFTPREFLDKMF